MYKQSHVNKQLHVSEPSSLLQNCFASTEEGNKFYPSFKSSPFIISTYIHITIFKKKKKCKSPPLPLKKLHPINEAHLFVKPLHESIQWVFLRIWILWGIVFLIWWTTRSRNIFQIWCWGLIFIIKISKENQMNK